MSLKDESSLIDILHAARLVKSFVEDFDQEAFENDIMCQSAVTHQLTIIGEATKRISKEYRNRHPEMPWRRMAGMRDVLIHAYERVALNEVWIAATVAVPDLIRKLEPLVPPSD